MGRFVPSSPPSKWLRHQVERHVGPKSSRTTSGVSSVRSVRDTTLHIDVVCEPSHRRKWRRLSKAVQDRVPWHQSRAFFALLMVLLGVCLAWTLWLLLLTVAPNEAINYIMGTADLDHGSFWLLVEPSPFLSVVSVLGLSIIALGYFYVGALLLGWDRRRASIVPQCGASMDQLMPAVESPTILDLRRQFTLQRGRLNRSICSVTMIHAPEDSEQSSSETVWFRLRSRLDNLSCKLWHRDSDARKLMRLGIKIVDVAIQQFMLFQILEAGFPLPLVVACTAMVVSNALVVVVLIYSPSPSSKIGEAFIDSMLDLLIAIGFPVLVLGYCLSTFEFDHASQRLVADFYPPWSFETSARVHANPEQTVKVFKSLQSLRFQSAGVCAARICNNILLLVGFRRLVRLLRTPTISNSTCDLHNANGGSIYPRKHPLALLLLTLALFTMIYVIGSVHHSQQVCSSYPTCTMHAYRWRLSSASANSSDNNDTRFHCPCRVLIDVDFAPKMYSAWRAPPDATAVVTKLSASGDLEILQLVNRRLPVLPKMLRQCTRLRHMSLIFTHTTKLPHWTAEFTELEFLHIEGKSQAQSLMSLSKRLFKNMQKLTFLHLGAHPTLNELPDFAGLTNLRWITMAGLEAVGELPSSFSLLERLQIMVTLMMSKLETFPDLSRTRQVLKVLVIEPSPLCCNGFLQSLCDLDNETCRPFGPHGNESLTCLPAEFSATPEMMELFQVFHPTICTKSSTDEDRIDKDDRSNELKVSQGSVAFPQMPSESEREAALEHSMLQCEGILFRECKLSDIARPGRGELGSGICYSERFLPISCIDSRSAIELRRRQIQAHIGPPCNMKYEAWLGCSP